MDGNLFSGIVGGAGTAGLIAFGKWVLGRIRREGTEEIQEERTDERDANVRADIKGLREDLRSAVSEFRSFSVITTELRSSQAVVNTMTAKALDAIGSKQERHGDMLADHAATLRLLTDNVGLLRQRIDQVEKEGRAQ